MNEMSTPSAMKPAMQFGILFGVIMVLEFIIGYSMNIDPATNKTYGLVINLLNYLILPIALITMACNGFKKSNGGFVSFGQCLKIGVIICLIAGLIYAIFFTVFTLIFPEFIPELMEKMKTVMLEQNSEMTDEQLDMAISMTEKFMNPVIMVPVTLLMFAFIGLIWSLIIGAVVKKERPVSL
ncbi:DUF4199 domain-containing protein [Flavobacterium longum]|uniref:DUF4199 domain-containing protein n=1 Tax=Flavobacterium longum TaxID=1299340 RepID=UPI0039EB0539